METATSLPLAQVYEALEYETLGDLHNFLRTPQMFAGMVRARYQPATPQDFNPDSLEGQESATTEEKRLSMAAYVWTQLNPQDRQNLLQTMDQEDSREFQREVQSRLM